MNRVSLVIKNWNPTLKRQNEMEPKLSALKETFSDLLNYAPAKLIPGVINFLFLMFLTHLLTPAEYGNYTLVITSVTIISSFAITWISQANVRLYEKYNKAGEKDSYIITNILFFLAVNVLVSVSWFLIVCAFIYDIPKSLFYLLQLGSIYLFFESSFSFITGLFRAQRKSKKFMIFSLAKSFGTAVGSLLLIYYFKVGVEAILLISSLFSLTFFILFVVEMKYDWKSIFSNYSKKYMLISMKYGMPLSLSALSAYGLSLSDRYVLQFYLGTEAVGVYSAGYRFSEMSIMMLAGLGVFSAFPIIIKVYEQEGKTKAQEIIRKLSEIYILTLSPMLLIMILYPKEIVNVFFGKAYDKSYVILPIVAGGAFLWGLSQYINKGFELVEKTIYLLYLLLTSALVTIALNFVLIPVLGIMGAAYATLSGYAVYTMMSFYFSRNILRWSISKSTALKVILASLTSFLVAKIISIQTENILFNLVFNSSIAIVVYSVLLLLLKEKNVVNYASVLQLKFKSAQ